MKIAIIGTGYVGLVTGACFSQVGNQVWCVDNDLEKINTLNQGQIPIYEPQLEEFVAQGLHTQNLIFTSDIQMVLAQATVVFITVGTPMKDDGSPDLSAVLAVAKEIGQNMSHKLIIVNKSTVPVGTGDTVRREIQSVLDFRESGLTFDVVSNPEFLKEGSAIDDFLRPDRVVIGAENIETVEMIKQLYAPFVRTNDRFIEMSVRSAEMTKYAANAMLATKISFINEIAMICERVGADVNKVRIGIGSDHRIGYNFIYPGCGYGGSCFPKDVKALEALASEVGLEPGLLNSVSEVNERQKIVLVHKVQAYFGKDLSGLTFAIWGLSFKPNTDDMREAPSIIIIKALVECGATILAYDPKAVSAAKNGPLKDIPNLRYVPSKYDALDNADALLLITEWKEFKSPDFDEMGRRMKAKVIFDGRNQYSEKYLRSIGFGYHQIGVQPVSPL